tara:strand:+ start:4841 stop:5014 length:174 start_codon:yes stop_codon:yes gene_type:complete
MELLKQNLAVEDLSLLQDLAHEKTLVHECLNFQVQENVAQRNVHALVCQNFLSSLVK